MIFFDIITHIKLHNSKTQQNTSINSNKHLVFCSYNQNEYNTINAKTCELITEILQSDVLTHQKAF